MILMAGDPSNFAFTGAITMTVGSVYTPQRSIGVNCTGAGNVSLLLSDASVVVVAAAVGWQTFPFAVVSVNTSGTTATATYYNLI
jgi:hypothetical protein